MSTDLRTLRRASGLSARELADLVAVGRTSIHRWERRERLPGPHHIHALARALGAPTASVAGFFDDAREPVAVAGLRAPGLRTVRRVRGLSAARLADLVGVPAHTVYNWESGRARVPDDLVPTLATALGIDARRLPDVVRRPARVTPDETPRPPLAVLRLRRGLSQVRAAEALGICRSTLRLWEDGSTPSLDSLRRMAGVYGVPVSRVAVAAGVQFPRELDPTTWTSGDLPAVLRVLRSWSGLTQQELASRCGSRTSTVRTWESGRCRPGAEFRTRLEALYRLQPGALLNAYPRVSVG